MNIFRRALKDINVNFYEYFWKVSDGHKIFNFKNIFGKTMKDIKADL